MAREADRDSKYQPNHEPTRERHESTRERLTRQRLEELARLSRADASGTFRPDLWREGIAQLGRLKNNVHFLSGFGGGSTGSGTLVGAQWKQVGPAPLRATFTSGPGAVAGRIYDVAIDPSGGSDQIIYIATVGGIWKSTDGGATWAPKTDRLPWNQMGAVALDPSNPSIVYAGADSSPGPSLFRSIDGGETWSVVGGSAMLGQSVTRIVLPTSGVILVGTFINGLFRSIDGGTSFGNNSPFFNNNAAILGGQIWDLDLDTASPSTVYACVGGQGILKSTNGGASFPTNLFSGAGAPAAGTYNCLTMAQSTQPNNQTLYASVSNQTAGTYVGLFKSVNGGGSWTIQPAAGPVAAGGQFGFDQTIGVDPQDAQRVYLGFQNLHVSSNGGGSFTADVTAGKVHADHHAIAFSPSSHWGAAPTRLYVGTDGGFAASGDGGTNWANLNEGVATILVGLGSLDVGRRSAANNGYSYAGSQDNGTAVRQAGFGGTDWKPSLGGDGGFVAVDSWNPQRAYATVNDLFRRTGDGGVSWQVGLNLPAKVVPLVVDPNTGANVYAGGGPGPGWGQSLYQSTDNGQTFTNIHTFPAGILCIAVVPFRSSSVWVGLLDGTVWRSDNALVGVASVWTSFSTGLPVGRGATSIAVDPMQPTRVVVGYWGASGIPAPNRSQHVYFTTNNGATWVDASGTDGGPVATNLPDRPVFAVALDPGSSNGLFGIAWSGGLLVAVGLFGTVLTSLDGVQWTEQASNAFDTLADVVWTGSQFVAVGLGGTILTSPDGAAWTARKAGPPSEALQGVAWSGSTLVATSASVPTVYTSPNGHAWTQHDGVGPHALLDVAWGSGTFVAVGYHGTIITSPDGDAWATRSAPTTDDLVSVAWSGTQFVATGLQGTILTSPDGLTWTARTSPTTNEINDVAWSGSRFVGVINTGQVVTSLDGVTWTLQASATGRRLIAVTWTGGQFVAVGDVGSIITSADGLSWTDRSVAGEPFALLAGTDTTVLRSVDAGATWHVLGVGLPTTSCMSLALDWTRDPSLLRVGTNGRSVFELVTTVGPRIAVTSNLAFGRVAVGSLGTLTAQVFNIGSSPLTVTAIALQSGSGAFHLQPGVILPTTLAPGAELDLLMQFQPTSAGNATAVFGLKSNDPVSPTLGVPMSGIAV
jgi:hypothetical protein